MARKKAEKKAISNKSVMTVNYGKPAIAAPKLNTIASNCLRIAGIASKAKSDGTVTPLGHKLACKGGVIDLCILSGRCNMYEDILSSLKNSGLAIVKADIAKYTPETVNAVLAKRALDHVTWCATTANNSHGGFGSRLAKTGLLSYHVELASLLEELAGRLKTVYSVTYAGYYKNRNKTGLI